MASWPNLRQALPVSPDTCTINGYHYDGAEAAWMGLDWSRAEVRDASIWGEDHHLRVPWCHPVDQPDGWVQGICYRVRPISNSWRFVKEGDAWRLALE